MRACEEEFFKDLNVGSKLKSSNDACEFADFYGGL